MENTYILAINPGSTSTKVAVSIGTKQVFLRSILHTAEDLEKFDKISDQFEFRKELILNEIKENGYDLSINRYKEIVYNEIVYKSPDEIINGDSNNPGLKQLTEDRMNLLNELLLMLEK